MSENSRLLREGEYALVEIAGELLNVANQVCSAETFGRIEQQYDELVEATLNFSNDTYGVSAEVRWATENRLQEQFGVTRWQELIANVASAVAADISP